MFNLGLGCSPSLMVEIINLDSSLKVTYFVLNPTYFIPFKADEVEKEEPEKKESKPELKV